MLEIENLFCGYDSKIILQDITLRAENGEFLGIIGPNGSGKTTLLKAITRILKPKAGVIFFEGKNIRQMGFKELAKNMAVVPQDSLTNNMSVEEFVLLGRIPYYRRLQFLETNKDKGVAENALALTGTLHLKERSISEISGGERQLVLIARALAQQPKLLLLDEPTAHLDITHQVGILDLIRRLNQEFGITVMMVLHDLNLAGEYCQRLVLIDNGRIHRIGTPEEIFNYRDIEDVYKTKVLIERNPVSLKPYIVLVSGEEREGLR